MAAKQTKQTKQSKQRPRAAAAAPGFTLCTLNAGGLRSAERKGFLPWLAQRKPDVLALQELRAHEHQIADELRSPAGYNTRWCCAEKLGYAGVAVYSRTGADRYRAGRELGLQDSAAHGLAHGDREGRVLRADFPDLTVLSLYVPSGTMGEVRQRVKIEFLQRLLAYTKELLAEGRPVAILGDVNIAPTALDIHDPRGNANRTGFLPEERAWFAKLLEQGWTDALRAAHPDEPGLYSMVVPPRPRRRARPRLAHRPHPALPRPR